MNVRNQKIKNGNELKKMKFYLKNDAVFMSWLFLTKYATPYHVSCRCAFSTNTYVFPNYSLQ